MAFISEFTNEIYDQGNAAFQDQGDSTRVFLGVLVTLLPKVIRPPTQFITRGQKRTPHNTKAINRGLHIASAALKMRQK